MSVITCDCSPNGGNTGQSGKNFSLSPDIGFFIVPLVADDGTLNRIDLNSDTLNAAYFEARINDTDPSKRWYPVQGLENIENLQGDPIVQTLNSGVNIITSKGVRAYTGFKVGAEPQYQKNLKNHACRKFGIFQFNECGDLKGDGSTAGFMAPRQVNENNWNPVFVEATNTSVQGVSVNFEFSKRAEDCNMIFVAAGDMGDAELVTVEGLVDLRATEALPAPSATSITFDAFYLNGGSATNPVKFQGGVAGDFSILNVTDDAAVAVLTATEITAGRYTLTFAAETVSDVLRPSITKTSFDGSALGADITLL